MKKSVFFAVACAALFFVGVVGFVSLLAGNIFSTTAGIGDTADGFFESIANGDNRAARNCMSVEFSNSITESEFDSFILDNEFDQYSDSAWSQSSVADNQAELEGSITTSSGEVIPVVVSLIDEQGEWKIQQLQRSDSLVSSINEPLKLAAGKESETAAENAEQASMNTAKESSVAESILESNPMDMMSSGKTPIAMPHGKLKHSAGSKLTNRQPDKVIKLDEVRVIDNGVLSTEDIPNNWRAAEIVKDWTVDFCKGVSEQDFSDFHSKTTPQFQNQVPLEKFTQIFQRFLDNNIDTNWVRYTEPEFTRSPSLDADGVLRMEGNFPANPPVKFDYSFKKNSDQWQLFDINMVVNPSSDDLVIPSMDDLSRLAKEQTKAFGNSVKSQDFTIFHQNTSKPFRKEINLSRFSTIFRKFFVTNADLDWIGNTTPVFDAPPSLNTKGHLHMKGYFPVEPRVDFKYGFIKEDSVWKIMAINISIPSGENVVE